MTEYETPQATNCVVGCVGRGRGVAVCIVGAELLVAGLNLAHGVELNLYRYRFKLRHSSSIQKR